MIINEKSGASHADERVLSVRETRGDIVSSVSALPELRPTVYCPSPVVARCLDAGRD